MEYWDIYNRDGQKTGYVKEKGSALLDGEYHLAMEAWIADKKGRILVQQRSPKCELLPNVWCMTTGRMKAGEDSLGGCMREVKEELGLSVDEEDIHFIHRLIYHHMIWDIYLIKKDVDITQLQLQSDEVAQVKWVSPDEFRWMIEREETFVYPDIRTVLTIVEAQAAKQ
ncbi:MAG: NUDIX hydrolase [Christensenellales bacterium]